MGEVILPKLKALKRSLLVVDFDPMMIEQLKHKQVTGVYGDAGDPDFLMEIKLEKSKLVISTIPDAEISYNILEYLKNRKFTGAVIVTAKTKEQAEWLYSAGATFVIIPSVLGGQRFGELLNKEKFDPKAWSTLAKASFSIKS